MAVGIVVLGHDVLVVRVGGCTERTEVNHPVCCVCEDWHPDRQYHSPVMVNEIVNVNDHCSMIDLYTTPTSTQVG
jgi:hypothetical protein